jgi:AraC-like DNA-binding protein
VLAPYVDHYWITRWDRRGVPARAAAALLDPCVHLQLHDGRAELMGVMRSAYRMHLDGMGCVLGVRFRPGGFYPFVQQPVARWTDRTVLADQVLPDGGNTAAWVNELWKAVIACQGSADAHAAIVASHFDAFLAERLIAHDRLAEEMATIVAHIAATPDVRRVSDLAQMSGRSERTLHRLFLRYVGVSPAWVIRRYRLHAAAERLTNCPMTELQGLAYALGYADQAHFMRDFRKTIGVPPGAYAVSRGNALDADHADERGPQPSRLCALRSYAASSPNPRAARRGSTVPPHRRSPASAPSASRSRHVSSRDS